MTQIAIAYDAGAELGECPLWSPSRNRLLWVDTLAPTLNLLDPGSGENATIAMPGLTGFVAEDPFDELVVGIGCKVASVSAAGSVRTIAMAPHAKAGFRLNDARFDRSGRLWVGLMDEALTEESGRLYRLDPDGAWHEADNGFTLVNGLDWSPDRRTLYVTDSRRGEIYAYDFDERAGTIGQKRVWFRMSLDDGKPDGLLVCPDGMILSVLFDGAAILRIAPDGRPAGRIDLPVPRPTSCALAPHGDRLYVTTARLGLNADAMARAPWSGTVLSLPCPGEGSESHG
jgi:sugar lactone lactonase YvrE